jgi:uncharacterized phage protein (predicted DNA packaging)
MTRLYSRVTLPPLVTLAELKTHLRITDTAHDADVAQKLAAAQEGILSVIGTSADPAWTSSTAPLEVKNYILILATHYYEHRGDELERDQAAIWSTIQHGLAFYRDPAIG